MTIDITGIPTTFEGMLNEAHQNAVDHGWWDDDNRSFGEIIALIHSELSEAFEEYRNAGYENLMYMKDGKPEGIAVELADAIIRIFDVAGHKNIPLLEAMLVKLAYNRSRPYRHGNKLA